MGDPTHAIGGWIAFVILSFAIGGMVGTKKPADDNSHVGTPARRRRSSTTTSPPRTPRASSSRRPGAAMGYFNGPVDVTVSQDKQVAQIAIPIKGDGTNATSMAGLDKLRAGLVDQTVGRAPGVHAGYVAGMTAETRDFSDLMMARAPLVFAFVLTLAFILLLVTFRSIVIPIKAIVLNLLSVGAAYGVLTWIFQDGHLERQLGFTSNGGVTSWLPLFLFVILFGSRWTTTCSSSAGSRSWWTAASGPRTRRSRASAPRPAPSRAPRSSWSPCSGSSPRSRSSLLGKWNWYLPSKLGWLPHISHEPAIE